VRSGPLDALFCPRAVAVIGASANPLSIGHIVLRNLRDHGFRGPLYPVNPHEREVLGLPAFASIEEVPGEVDLVNLSLRHERVLEVLAACGRRGVRFAVVHTAGYREVGPAGAAREAELLAAARAAGVRIFGPNSQGVQSSAPEVSLYANFTFTPMRPGRISILAQSGGMGELLKLHLHRAGVGHRLYASYGNEADVSLAELLEHCGRDPGTGVVLLQVETLRDPAAVLAAARVVARRVPVLALKCGRTAEGARAVSSHTGALVDQASATSAIFERAGVLELRDASELIQAGLAAACQPLPAGRRLALITNTGGPAVQAVDVAVERGLELAPLSEELRERLRPALHPEASLANPIDLVATATPEHYRAALRAVLAEEAVHLALVTFVTAPFVDQPAIAAALAEAAAGAEKPVAVVVETLEASSPLIAGLRAVGLPVFELPEEGARCLASLATCAALRRRVEQPPPRLVVDRGSAAAILERNQGRPGGLLPGVDALTLIAAYGIRIPRLYRVRTAEDLPRASARVGFPCVLKADSPRALHKAAAGAVVLGLGDEPALAQAFAALRERFPAEDDSFFVLEQRPAGRELALGASASPGLGHLILFGVGGVELELLRDVAFAVSPLSRLEAQRLLGAIRAAPALASLDLAALEEMLVRLARLVSDFPAIAELDINPVIAYAPGTLPVAVDARVVLAPRPLAPA